MADQVEAFRNDLQERVWAAPADTRPEAVVLANLDCNWDQRFGHPVVRDAAAQVVAAVARTYNPAEQFFSQAKRKLRRRLGRTHLGQDMHMQDQPAEAALAANLLDPRYVRIVCGTLDDLPRAFARLEQAGIVAAQPMLDRDQRHSTLRHRIREMAPELAPVPTNSPPHSGRQPQNPPKAVMPN